MDADHGTATLESTNVVRTGPRGGTPVVLVHPAGLELSYWDRQIEALCDDHDVVTFDLPGHGRTAGTPQDWTVGGITDRISQVVSTTGAQRVHLVGVSLGGMLAQAFAISHPGMLQSLVLMNSAPAFPDGARAVMRERGRTARQDGMAAIIPSLVKPWFTPAAVARRPDLLDRVGKTLIADDPLVQAAMWDMIASFDVRAGLPRITCPTMVLVGEADDVTPIAMAQNLRSSIPVALLRVVPHAAHLPHLEQPDVVNAHLRSFLAGPAW